MDVEFCSSGKLYYFCCRDGEIGRRTGLKIQRGLYPVRVRLPLPAPPYNQGPRARSGAFCLVIAVLEGRDMNEFDPWALYYDYIHPGLPGEMEFYLRHALHRGNEVVELGCGTGRVAIPMAMKGLHVLGVDISAGMLAICGEKRRQSGVDPEQLQLLQGDMANFHLNRRFPLVIIPYRSFMHLLEPERQAACLTCVRALLEPGGVCILNLWAARPSAIAPHLQAESEQRLQLAGFHAVPGEDCTLVHFHGAHYEESTQRILEQHVIQEKDGAGTLLHTAKLSLTRAWLTPREMQDLALRCGYEIEAMWGDFDETDFGPESTEMIWVLRAL
jgi:SAM-dependent methyltransferase